GLFTWPLADVECLNQTISSIQDEGKSHYFLYLPELDAALHKYGTQAHEIETKLSWYENELRHLMEVAQENYQEVRMNIFSDHGMTDTIDTRDIMQIVEDLGLAYDKDYVCVYDSTMVRFWFLDRDAKEKIVGALDPEEQGRFLSDQELHELGIYWADHRYGDAVFLMKPGVLVMPSYMSKYEVPSGMHGFHPDDASSDGVFLSNTLPKRKPKAILDIFDLIN
ncbi:MAG TPA: alkaline phosphatase family protein, partial [Nitrososphaeraceae archaeon]|nr:alkaline phosphatase family protein [Nitrososphaeraceae archaeon]